MPIPLKYGHAQCVTQRHSKTGKLIDPSWHYMVLHSITWCYMHNTCSIMLLHVQIYTVVSAALTLYFFSLQTLLRLRLSFLVLHYTFMTLPICGSNLEIQTWMMLIDGCSKASHKICKASSSFQRAPPLLPLHNPDRPVAT